MKPGIHPEYQAGDLPRHQLNHSFLTRSAIDTKGRETMKWEDGKEYPVVKVEVSSESHSVLHRQAEDRGHRRPRREVQAALHQEDPRRKRPSGGKTSVFGGMLPRLSLPPSPATLALIALAFALPGLAGHDLWKTHDAIGLGIVHDMATSGAPLVPRIAGMPVAVRPAALPLARRSPSAARSSSSLEFHSAARLASGVLVLAAFWLIYVAARDWGGGARRPPHAAARPRCWCCSARSA